MAFSWIAESHIAGEDWHSDVSCDPEPPMGSILYLREVPLDGAGHVFQHVSGRGNAIGTDPQVETTTCVNAVLARSCSASCSIRR